MAETPFARDPQTAAYYDRRAAEYDDWYLGTGLFADRHRPGWDDEVAAVIRLLAGLAPARTLDVACGTGFLTRHLPGSIVAIDQSALMVRIAQDRLPNGIALVGDALALPFADGAFDRVVTSHFYGHLPPTERERFLDEAARVGRELLVIDSALRPDVRPEEVQQRVLADGSRHHVFKRFLRANQLAVEVGGEPLFAGTWFVAARARWGDEATSGRAVR